MENVNLITATKDMFTKYFKWSGRTSRASFWWAVLGYVILSTIYAIIMSVIITITGNEGLSNYVSLIWTIITIWPCLGLQARRLQDINKSPWLLLIGLIPFLGSIILLVFYLMPSVNEGNKYNK